MRDLNYLASETMQGRGVGSEGSARAADYIIKRLNELGLKPCAKEFVQEFTFKDRSGNDKVGKNIVACQAGTNATNATNVTNGKADYLVISAHYDHLGMRDKTIYFGADDNASGVAGVLAVAEQFKNTPPNNHIAYAFFDAEEIGLKGAMAFVAQNRIPVENIIANLNFDMIARGDKNELFVSGTHQTPAFKPVLTSLNGIDGIKVSFDHDKPEQKQDDWTNQSDHYAFYQRSIPHLYFGVEDHADYHKPSDTADKVNPKFFDGAVNIVRTAVRLIDAAASKVDFRSERKKYANRNN
ncbi:M28 family peptidase [Undibacterium cyanobacteriorum]|uniref:M28 family peptidase n=1 Tax=Undibacterium cyanobacteriorum TaxID=3073561 RepID=A0ABY9RHI7_9BURK|nr:M20/M25/M40 family metallo-hydrolase [Undibacterium sp. 20NA77.5]WMW79556.1 M28 family peptidase [Undibacterium sp. 20NA77.5]